MVIYPDREMDAARVLVDNGVGGAQACDAVRIWGWGMRDITKRLEAGQAVLMIHDGVGSKQAVEPNKDQWLVVFKCEDPYRGCPLAPWRSLAIRLIGRRSGAISGPWWMACRARCAAACKSSFLGNWGREA